MPENIDSLNGIEKNIVSKIYNDKNKIRVVSFNSFLEYVEEKAMDLITQ